MARSKKTKRLKPMRRDETFYEALPMTMTPTATLPEVSEQLAAGASAVSSTWSKAVARFEAIDWTQAGRTAIARAESAVRQAWAWLQLAGLHFTETIMRWGDTVIVAGRSGADTASALTPPLVRDLAGYLARTGRMLASRRARSLYLSLAATGALTLVIAGAITAASVMTVYANDISSPSALLSKKKTGTTILDRNGQVLFEGYGAQATKEVDLGDVPMSLRNATLAAEDPDFYQHPGFSWKGMARAAWVDVSKHGTVEGGSTLTQQLVKNALLTSSKDFGRKYQEILLAVELEKRYSKDQILDMYLNEIYYGEGSSGVDAAAQTYFHKSVKDLTLGESALLAGLPLGPSRFDPHTTVKSATGRHDYVLTRMQDLGKITKAEADAAKAQPLKLAAAGAPDTAGGADALQVYAKTVNIRAPHFVFYVLDQLRAQYGDDVVEQGGITVTTTLDLKKQQLAEASISKRISDLAGHNVTNGGLISIIPSTGDILAMVGSVDYNAPGFGNVNVTLSSLQPGSSFKPIAYATAFKKGWNGASKVDDAPMQLPNGDGSLYIPQNYDGKFRGPVTLREALANSLNIPALKVEQFATVHDTIATAHDMGVTGLNDENRYGLALVLGGGEVRPIDMATVYATFANGGDRVAPRSILKVVDRRDHDMTKSTAITKTPGVLDSRIAYMITNILSDNDARTPEFGANSPLKLSRPAAAKTGTTNDFRDNWTVGYTPQIATAVWVGNNDHTAMNNVDGITGAAPIWHDYMEGALSGLPVVDFAQPAGVTLAKVCKADGGLANPWDSGFNEVFFTESAPTKPCSSYNSHPFEKHQSDQTPSPTPDQGNENTDDNPPTPPVTPPPTPINTPFPTRTPRGIPTPL
jgi:1A family penicillin-binding protein